MISVAIVTLNNPNYLDLALKSLRRNSKTDIEVLIHLNECTNASYKIAKKWYDEGLVKVISKSDVNQYCARPLNNLFNNRAHGDYFIFLDDDVYVAPGWDLALLEAMKLTRYFWLSPTVYYPRYKHQPKRFNTQSFGLTPETFNEDAFNEHYLDCRNILEDNSNWISGGGLIPWAVWKEINGYDNHFKIGEDVDLKAKIWNAAVKNNQPYDFRSIADSIIYHFGHSGSSKRELIVDPFVLFKEKWGISIKEFYKKALPEIDYL